jgi:hypothetical protein
MPGPSHRNVGVRVVYNGTTIAIWKADKDGKLPAVGESGRRQINVHHPARAIAATTDLASGAEELDDILKHKKTADEPDNH